MAVCRMATVRSMVACAPLVGRLSGVPCLFPAMSAGMARCGDRPQLDVRSENDCLGRMRSRRWGLAAVVTLATLGIGTWLVLASSHVPSTPPCSELPSRALVNRVLRSHVDAISKLEDLPNTGGSVWVQASSPRQACREKAVVEITYDNVETRSEIREFLGDTFFGVPYMLHNV